MSFSAFGRNLSESAVSYKTLGKLISNQIYKCKWKVQVGGVEYSWNHYCNVKGFLCEITDFVLALIALLTFTVKTSAKLAGGGSIKR